MAVALFLTRTLWSEPPRLRHQLARLLASRGHTVHFCQRASHLPGRRSETTPVSEQNRIVLHQYYEPMHHQLKIGPMSTSISNWVVRRSLVRFNHTIRPDLVVNFNHDYAFAREAFPEAQFATVVNDDFEGLARPWVARQTTARLARTCRVSDVVFAVSSALLERVANWSATSELLLPWASNPYRRPPGDDPRTVVLYYGYINEKIDWSVVESVAAAGVSLRFVGPVARGAEARLSDLTRRHNAEVLDPCAIESLELSDVVCSIVPYDTDLQHVRVMTVGNRVFQLLSRGIPIVHARLPGLLELPDDVLVQCSDTQEYLDAIGHFREHFQAVQDSISAFLEAHTGSARMRQLAGRLPSLRSSAAADATSDGKTSGPIGKGLS